ncbi:STELLO glycosyltransferase family protein [Methylobacterium radiotolerans]|uniref:STELLO glycosyltransferase family protein n=1 Tax=Methylobacterium radiotolerans TaxID=31998 RepID=UPI001F340C78|nr:STELLO glycosyltransferase family protein [Methylobacterium radiotolerans]UIY43233.1 STELLO glycosyltransferase family protein [Methylobacterium radiotolerans]
MRIKAAYAADAGSAALCAAGGPEEDLTLTEKYAVVVTTINAPTRAVVEINRDAETLEADFIVVGDSKSPPDFALPGATYLDLSAQQRSGLRFAELCPAKHYARKNVGYLEAMRAGATVIIETDDDNIPRPEFWVPRAREQTGPIVEEPGWCNVYQYFTDTVIWPRGLPLIEARSRTAPLDTLQTATRDCPIQQGLADGDPDVDAIYRLTYPLPLDFEPGRTIILDAGTWCPFNSQNTTFWRDAFPLLYLPYYCSFRMTDIWRSFIAQRIGWTAGWSLQFHSSTVFQERNDHNLMHDFKDEIPGYLENDRIKKTLEDLDLASGTGAIPENITRAYEALITLDVVGSGERDLLRAWLSDIQRVCPTP